MRKVLALTVVSWLLLGAAAPHVHAGVLGEHACVACVTAGAEHSPSVAPELAPRIAWFAPLVALDTFPPVTGVAVGAIPGQSPPATSSAS